MPEPLVAIDGKKLKVFRKKEGMTQAELGKEAAVARRRIQQIEATPVAVVSLESAEFSAEAR